MEEPPRPILVVLSGDKRVDVKKLAEFLGVDSKLLRKMTADEVKEYTGYSIGGVPPFAHEKSLEVFADNSLFRFEKIWAAAGGSNAVMPLRPNDLNELGIHTVNVSES